MGNIAAFFDIDGTLYRDSLLIEHFKKLKNGPIACPLPTTTGIRGRVITMIIYMRYPTSI